MFLCREPGKIVVVADLRAMTEVTANCGQSVRVEKRDGARVQLMMWMRGPSRRWAILVFLTLGTAWTILCLRVMQRLKVERIRRERSTGTTIRSAI